MIEHVRQKQLLTRDRSVHAWSVSFDANSVSPNGIREDLARNMVANVAVGDEEVRNDFDQVSIYQRPIFNATWDSEKGYWVDFVAKGEEGFTFSPTAKNREVVYRCQPFWYKLGFDGLYGPNYVSVSDRPLEGYQLAPMFRDGNTFEYRPCFELTIGEDGLPHSRSGMMPFEGTPTELMEKVFSYDSASRAETMADWFSDYLLLLVEFGTRNLQGVMRGVTRGMLRVDIIYDDEEWDAGIGMYTYFPEDFTVGKTYRFAYMEDGKRITREVELIEIGEDEVDAGYPLYFDFEDQYEFILEHHVCQIYESPKETGEALIGVCSASSGRADEDPYSACVWRGKENPWGNFSSFICDFIFEAVGKQGMFNPYTLGDLRKFDGTINAAYTKRTYTTKSLLKGASGYIVSFTRAEKDHYLVPADFSTQNPAYYYATLATISPNTAAKGVRYVRVGGDYTQNGAVNHATYELIASTVDTVRFGARLVLQEGL